MSDERRFNVNNPPKFYGILLYLTLASTGWFIGRMETVEWIAATGPVIGYLVGNGVAAKRKEPIEPAIAWTTDTTQQR